nr:MAG TPA: Large polyvalent protein associated domain 29 [Caudoviricetes sp.]
MKATFNEIIENLVKVLTDKAESAQYYSDNEQYICLCGWCGIMSPVSRPAYVKTFGKDTTEQAEAKAREIIAEKEAARQRTKYAEHAREADRLEGVPAVGGFFWADNSGLKCDGGRGLFEELHALNYYTDAQNTPARLCCVEQIIKVSDDDFARPGLADELVTRYNLQGFARSEDVDDNDNTYNNNPEKLATFYTVGTLVVSPSGKYYLIDSEGYNYARYIYVPIEWPVMLADEVAAVKAKEEARKAEEERQAAEEKAQRLADYRARCAKWSPLMRNVEKMEQEGKATARKIDNARKANILAMCAAAFPGVKFSVSVRRGWGADFELTWTDGPTVEEFNEKTDLSLFCRCRDTFDGWDDSTGVDYAEFADFARLTMGSNGGDIKATREMSDEARAELLAQIFAAVPAADNRNKYGYTDAYTYTNKEAEAVAAALGVGVFDIFAYGYAENAETIARRAWDKHSYTKTTTPEPTDPKPGKAQAPDNDNTDDAPAEGLELVEIPGGVAVVGGYYDTLRNRKQIKAHGARWNKEAKQWQATDAEAVARLREWFGVSEPKAEKQEQHTHTTASDNTEQQEQPEQPTAEEVARVARFAALLADVIRTFEQIATAAQQEAQRAKETATKQAEAEQLRADIAKMSAQVAKMTEALRMMAERLDEIDADNDTSNNGTTADNEPQPETEAQERPERGEGKPEALGMLKAAAEHVARLTAANDHTAALLARLYVLAAVGLRVRPLIQRAKAIEAAQQRGHLTPDEVSDRQRISQETERRAALLLTPEEFRTLYGYDPKTDRKAA